MARPKLADADRRDERSEQRYTLAELEHIKAQAQRAGISASEFIRRRALSQPVRAANVAAPSPALISELNRIGVNLNQLTRAVHRGRDTSGQWDGLDVQLATVLEAVIEQHGS